MALMSSFDSKVNRNFRTSSVLLEIKKSHLVNPVHGDGKDVLYITDLDTDVSPLQHPLYDPDADVVYVDMRGYSDMSRTGEFNVKPNMDSELQLLRAKLELCWMRCTSNELYSAFGYANEIYVRWFTTHISSMKSLTPAQDTKLRALVALFNIGQYYNNITEPALITRYYRLISQTFYIPMEDVEQVASSITQTFPRDLSEFVEAVREANISTRLNDLNEVTILNTLSRAWFFTANPGPVIGLAVEYPPAFCALVSMATKYRLFKKTGIGAIVEQNTRRDAHNNHVRAINILIDQKVGEPHPGKYRDYGMEQYPINVMATPDFNYQEVGAESDMLSKILAGVAAGSIAGLLTYGIVKFIEWVTGGGSGGGGGSSGSSSKSIQAIQIETDDIIKKTHEAVKRAYDQQQSIGRSVGTSFEEMTEQVLKFKGKLEDAGKYADVLCKHFSGEDQIAALSIYNLHAKTSKNNHKEVAEKLIEIDKKTQLFKNNGYALISLLVQNKLRASMIAAITILSGESGDINSLLNDVKEQYDEVLSKLSAFTEQLKNGMPEDKLHELLAAFKAQLESSDLDKMVEMAAAFNSRIQLDELGTDILADTTMLKALHTFNPNAKLPEDAITKYHELVDYVGKKKAVVNTIVETAKSISDDDNHVVNKVAREFSSVTAHGLRAIASATRPIRAAVRFSDVYVKAYRTEAANIAAEIDKYKASLDKLENKKE